MQEIFDGNRKNINFENKKQELHFIKIETEELLFE
jgi:hypothetical protein